MATRRWCGRAGGVAQVDTLTPASVSVGSTFTLTINQRAVTYTAAAATVADVTAGLVAAVQAAAGYPEFQELAWDDQGTRVAVTGPADGTPFTLSVSAGGTGSPTLTRTTATSPSGPNWWTAAANWLEGAVPVAGDDVYVDQGPSILYGLDQSAVTLSSLTVTPQFPAASQIGLPRTNPAGYVEYRPQRLRLGATAVAVETASGRVRLDLAAAATTVDVLDTGEPADGDAAALDLVAANAANALRVNRGSVAVAAGAGETSQFASVRVSFRTQRDADARVALGAGLTLAALEQNGGQVDLRCGVTTHTKEGGACTRTGAGAVGTLFNRAGEYLDGGTGTITTLHQAGSYRRTGLAPLTVTTATLYGGGATRDPSGVITWTNPVQCYECSLSGGPDDDAPPAGVHYFDPGRHRKLTVADI